MRGSSHRHLLHRTHVHCLAGALLAFWLSGAAVAAHYDFDARMATVTALIEAGRRLDPEHQVDQALALVETVQAEAVAAFRAGRTEAGYQRLDQAYVLVQTVVRRLASDPTLTTPMMAPAPAIDAPADGRGARFDDLARSVMALEEAYRAIRQEVGDSEPDRGPEIARLAGSATRDRDAGRLDPAMRQMKQAYVLLQAEINRLRGGQTLVRELRFASEREEYEYEVDRHDSHLLLVELLLVQPRQDPAQAAIIRAAVDDSMRMHWIAHKHAAAGEYRHAVIWLEQASDALAALIRSYGHDIP